MKWIELSERIMVALYQNPATEQKDHRHNAIEAVRAAIALQEMQAKHIDDMKAGKTECTPEMINNSVEFLEASYGCTIIKRLAVFYKAKCGNCHLKKISGVPEAHSFIGSSSYVEFERVLIKRRDGRKFEVLECPVCHHLVDAPLVDAAQGSNGPDLDFIY